MKISAKLREDFSEEARDTISTIRLMGPLKKSNKINKFPKNKI